MIGASTGGPQALSLVLSELPADLEPAVVVVQHMADGFIEGLAAWLDTLCPLPVGVGASGHRLRPGTVTIAPSGLNFVVHEQLRVTTHEPPASQYHVPGIDVTMSSVADVVGSAAVGVLLTGMGRDGAEGLRRMRDRGALTIAQDEETSAVYGMPAAAMAVDAVDLQLATSGGRAGPSPGRRPRAGARGGSREPPDAVRRRVRGAGRAPARDGRPRLRPLPARVARLRIGERMRATGCAEVTAYLSALAAPGRGRAERQELLDEVTIPETHFFRNPPQIRALRAHVLPELLRQAAGEQAAAGVERRLLDG